MTPTQPTHTTTEVSEAMATALQCAKIKLARYMDVHGPKGALPGTYVGGLAAEYEACTNTIDSALEAALSTASSGDGVPGMVLGWQTMETAPMDGHAVLLLVPEPDGFIWTVEGAYQNGQWNAVHRDNVQPTHWSKKLPRPLSTASSTGKETP